MRVWRMYCRNFLVEGDDDGLRARARVSARADRDFYGLAVEISGRDVPVLAFALVHVELDGVAVGAMEGFVTVEDDLHVVFAGLDVVEVADGVAEGGVVDCGGLAGLKIVDVDAEDHLGARGERDLHARLFGGIVGEDEEQATVEGLGAAFFGEGDGELGRGRVGRWCWCRRWCGSCVSGREGEKRCGERREKRQNDEADGSPRQNARARSHL
jgi:hypothetical protein